MPDFGSVLRELRLGAKLSQPEVAAKLQARGLKATFKTISKWEVGMVMPSLTSFLELCDLYGVRDPYSVFIGGAKLNAQGYARLCEYAGYLAGDKRYVQHKSAIFRLFDLPASAGTGNYADSDSYTEIELAEDDVPSGADYCVRVSGDSMEPLYHNGDIVFVEECASVRQGEVGIFAFEGDIFIKRLGAGVLISENETYSPIKLYETDSFRVFGRVLGAMAV